MSIIIAIVALGILVLIHEGGHFLAARLCKVKILKFSIGFGPRLYSFTKGDTEYAISLIPLGGYVKMKGENPDEKEINGDSDEFTSKKWYQRAFIAFAGPFANLVFAFLLFTASFLIGKNYNDQYPILDKALSPYENVFKKKDTFVKVNQTIINTWSDIFKGVKENKTNTFIIKDSLNSTKTINVKVASLVDFYNAIQPITSTKIGEVSSGMPAWKAGLQSGDIITKIDGKQVIDWLQIREMIKSSTKDSVLLTIKRGNSYFEKTLKPDINPLDKNAKIIGITQDLPLKIYERSNFIESLKLGSITTVNFTALNYLALYKLFENPQALKSSVGGPVMVFSMTKESSEKGFSDTLNFIAAISILLMIMNLLPIPILDGGHILFCFIEGLFRKAVPIKIQAYAQQVGFLLLMLLMVYAFTNDFSRLASRSHSLKSNQEVLDKQ